MPNCRLRLSVATLLAIAASAGLARAGDHLIFSEILADEVGSTFDGEWFEIYNPTNAAIDLSNYKIGDEETKLGTTATEAMFQFPAGASIAPGQIQIVSSYASRFKTVYGFAPTYECGSTVAADAWVDDVEIPNMSIYAAWDPDGAKLNMANTNDQALILDGADNIVDQASWVDSTFFFNPSLAQVASGQSWERLDLNTDTNTAADWRLTPSAPTGATWTSKSTPGALPAVVAAQWISDGDGAWIIGSNWENSVVPNGAGVVAVLGGSITAPRTVSLIESATVGTLRIDADHAYTIDGSGQLVMNAGTGVALVQVAKGSGHTISAPVSLASSTVFDVASAASLNITGDIVPVGMAGITKSGGGVLTLNRARASGLKVNAGTLAIHAGRADASTSVVNSLTVAAGATLDLGDNAIIIDYAGTATPLAAVVVAIADGRLTSSAIAADARLTIATADTAAFTRYTNFGGVDVDTSAVIARVALKGDTDIDGDVDFDDLVAIAQNYETLSPATWTMGDVTHDGSVNFDDLVPLAQNYGGTEVGNVIGASPSFSADWALAQSLVPEPAVALGLFAVIAPARRRR